MRPLETGRGTTRLPSAPNWNSVPGGQVSKQLSLLGKGVAQQAGSLAPGSTSCSKGSSFALGSDPWDAGRAEKPLTGWQGPRHNFHPVKCTDRVSHQTEPCFFTCLSTSDSSCQALGIHNQAGQRVGERREQGQTQAWSPRGTGVMVSVRSQTPEGSGRADHSVLTRTPAPPPPPRRLQHPSGAWGPPARLGATSCPQLKEIIPNRVYVPESLKR
ncbi:putative uncharacterized protein encoded by AGPAT4-IT1 [Manis javanica]|nr:putative uncharacterized protein encoded by AGPAT4-IT1 [Manis javanica]